MSRPTITSVRGFQCFRAERRLTAGYHLEHCRHVKGALPHERRAFILGKKPEYFTPEKYAWPTNVLEELSNEIGGGFEFVGAAGRAGVDQMPVKGVKNLGGMPKDQWSLEVARSGVMVSRRTGCEERIAS